MKGFELPVRGVRGVIVVLGQLGCGELAVHVAGLAVRVLRAHEGNTVIQRLVCELVFRHDLIHATHELHLPSAGGKNSDFTLPVMVLKFLAHPPILFLIVVIPCPRGFAPYDETPTEQFAELDGHNRMKIFLRHHVSHWVASESGHGHGCRRCAHVRVRGPIPWWFRRRCYHLPSFPEYCAGNCSSDWCCPASTPRLSVRGTVRGNDGSNGRMPHAAPPRGSTP